MSSLSARFVLRAASPVTAGRGERRVQAGAQIWFDVGALLIAGGALAFLVWGLKQITLPVSVLAHHPISLAASHLPEYMLRTTLRMLLAVLASLVFSLIYATCAAKSRRLQQILVPLLDILQSIPVLGYISFTVTGFLALFPGSELGMECASIFAIFTAQAWNMTFSLYQSFRTVPHDMIEAAWMLRLSPWQKFWRLEWPFAMPGLLWNMMMSMSGGWFFVVASEAITVGNRTVTLPGIGSYIALAIEQRNVTAIFCAIGAMFVIILAYDQLLFRPLVTWSEKFSTDATARQRTPHSWVLTLFAKSRLVQALLLPLRALGRVLVQGRIGAQPMLARAPVTMHSPSRALDIVWYGALLIAALLGALWMRRFFSHAVTLADIVEVAECAGLTLLRITALMIVASIIWVPIAVWVGLSPRATAIVQPMAQFLAAFPANLLFPLAVLFIHRYALNPNVWLSPLIILGTQWYILFNVIAGASSFPNDLREAASNLGIHGWLWWRRVILPGIFPYYLTGAITASGGSWNASIVAEAVNWGDQSYHAKGLGAYIAERTTSGDLAHIALGVGMMALVVTIINKFFWRRLYDLAARRLRWD